MTTSILEALDHHTTNHNLSPWLRLTLWAMANADNQGCAWAYPGELRTLLGVNSHEVSRAIRLAKDRHLLGEASNAGCLVVVGYPARPCQVPPRRAG